MVSRRTQRVTLEDVEVVVDGGSVTVAGDVSNY